MSNKQWMKKFKQSQQRMQKFDFKRFFEVHNCTVEELAELLGYTPAGVERMVLRGTIKAPLIQIMKSQYPDTDDFALFN